MKIIWVYQMIKPGDNYARYLLRPVFSGRNLHDSSRDFRLAEGS